MASIALSVVGCIDYLAYGTIFTRVMFLPKKKGDVFFSARKATDERWGVLNLLYERTLGKPTIGQLANNQRREIKFPNEGFFPMTGGRFPSDILRLDSHK
jgi:hypothetical protein